MVQAQARGGSCRRREQAPKVILGGSAVGKMEEVTEAARGHRRRPLEARRRP